MSSASPVSHSHGSGLLSKKVAGANTHPFGCIGRFFVLFSRLPQVRSRSAGAFCSTHLSRTPDSTAPRFPPGRNAAQLRTVGSPAGLARPALPEVVQPTNTPSSGIHSLSGLDVAFIGQSANANKTASWEELTQTISGLTTQAGTAYEFNYYVARRSDIPGAKFAIEILSDASPSIYPNYFAITTGDSSSWTPGVWHAVSVRFVAPTSGEHLSVELINQGPNTSAAGYVPGQISEVVFDVAPEPSTFLMFGAASFFLVLAATRHRTTAPRQ